MAVDTCVFPEGEAPPQSLPHTMTVQGVKWIAGNGKLPCDILFIGDYPGLDEAIYNEAFSSEDSRAVFNMAKAAGIDMSKAYLTNTVKFVPRGNKPSANDLKVCLPVLMDEIARSKAKVIVPLGAKALTAVMGKGYTPTAYHGTVLHTDTLPGAVIYPMFNPSYLKHNPNAGPMLEKDWQELAAMVGNKAVVWPVTDYVVVRDAFDLETFREFLFSEYKEPILVLDCEWDGEHGLDDKGWIRTMQIGYDYGKVLIVELYDEQGKPVADAPALLRVYKSIVEDTRARLVGHHLRADGLWLYFTGMRLLGEPIDLTLRTYFDTMVAEHVLNESGPFGLEVLTVKYTDFGRYDLQLMNWVNQHKKETEHGYGYVPSELLLPYAAIDVDSPRYIMDKQIPLMKAAGFMEPRGKYPSLWESSLFASVALYELEIEGLRVDKHRLNQIITMYQNARNKLEAKILPMAAALGFPDFNFRSWQQKGTLLFEKLGLQPIESTSGIPWSRVDQMSMKERELLSPSTDKTTMDILADIEGVHPIVALLRDMSKVDYVCRQWLVEEGEAAEFDTQERGGGLIAKIWPDGALHARFSQLKETARFGSSRPNV